MELDAFMEEVITRNPGETEFHQAVKEIAVNLIPFINKNSQYEEARILERMIEPDRAIIFRVSWEDDNGKPQVNRGYRVQFNNAIGPYKGGLRFHPTVNLSVLKFLGFEQIFKNSLTTLPMGGGKGGSDFNPKGKSDSEVMRFCQAFMTELSRYIGAYIDIPAGDIGVGAREIGFMYGQYRKLQNEFTGALTGKGIDFGGSPLRTEATGYGCVYFASEMLKKKDQSLEGTRCLVSGSGNVSIHTAEKLIEEGAHVVTLSDSSGFIHDPKGLDSEKLAFVKELKEERRGRISEYAEEFGCEYYEDKKPWIVPCDIAFPCATQNEIYENDARMLIGNGCQLVCEGANMPTSFEGIKIFESAGLMHAPSKAANAGGVAVSGLEMSQNALGLTWSREEIDERLKVIMRRIHQQCVEYGTKNGNTDYFMGANIAGFVKVADVMLAYGIV
jgi:glutamate dehydrogenase (NADP+)